jgi:hypothetical protein
MSGQKKQTRLWLNPDDLDCDAFVHSSYEVEANTIPSRHTRLGDISLSIFDGNAQVNFTTSFYVGGYEEEAAKLRYAIAQLGNAVKLMKEGYAKITASHRKAMKSINKKSQ